MLIKSLIAAVVSTMIVSAAPSVTATPSFHVTVTGKGRPMILIPGLSSSGKVWDATVAHYRANYECHVLTLAGFAGEPAIPAPFLETVRTDLAAYIRKNHLDKPVIVGHSLGGFMALWLASTEPDLPGPLVIVDSLTFMGGLQGDMPKDKQKEQADMMRRMIGSQSKEQYAAYIKGTKTIESLVTSPDDVAVVTGWALASDPKAVGEGMYDLFTTDLRDDVAKIKSPTLVIGTWVGMKDYTTKELVESKYHDQYAKLKNVRIVISDKAKHFVMMDDPDGLWAAMDSFLGK